MIIYYVVSAIIIAIIIIKWKQIKMMTEIYRKKLFPGLDERMMEIKNVH